MFIRVTLLSNVGVSRHATAAKH